jgi:hypothetical protein
MKKWTPFLATIAILGLVATASAQCPYSSASNNSDNVKAASNDQKSCSKSKSTACTKTVAAKDCCSSGKAACDPKCTGKELIASGAPMMVYKVGHESTRCPQQACEWSAKCDKTTVHYTVAGETYKCKTTARKMWAKALNAYLDKITEVRYAVGNECYGCPHQARQMADKNHGDVTFRVASYDFSTADDAKTAAKMAREAANNVEMKMVVDGKACCWKNTTFRQTSVKGCCSSTKAAKAGCDKPCGDKDGVKTASNKKSDCCKSSAMKTASNEKSCEKPCGDKATVMTASNTKSSCCSSTKAAKAGCDKPCGDKDGVKTASNKKSDCCQSSAMKTASNEKSCDKPCDKSAMKVVEGKSCEYRVGQMKTACRATAELELAKQRVLAAHRVLQITHAAKVAGL